MKKYGNEDYFSVIEINTGRKICDCSDEMDALMMVSFSPKNRTITKNKFMMGQVIDIEVPKALPTNEIVIDTRKYKQHQEEWMVEKINPLSQIKLPEGEGKPVKV